MTKLRILIYSLIILSINQNCAPFRQLPKNVEESSKIEGIYYNDCRNQSSSYTISRFWELIDKKNEFNEEGLFFKIEITAKNRLKVKLLRNDVVLRERTIKGRFKANNCYYTRRVFVIIPILPILWFYLNTQDRMYFTEDILVFETTNNNGGVAIFMAGGDRFNHAWEFCKVSY